MTLRKEFVDDPIKFLKENQYGFLERDDDSATYDFTWKATLGEVFDDIYQSLHSYSTDEDADTEQLDQEWRESLQLAKEKFAQGQSEQAFTLISDLWPDAFGERCSVNWWGTFEDLKSSDSLWPQQVRLSFRGSDDRGPITSTEEFDFANYVTCKPFEW